MFDVTDIVLIYFMSYNTDTSKKKKKNQKWQPKFKKKLSGQNINIFVESLI